MVKVSFFIFLGNAPVLCLSPAPTDKDFLFHLDEREGILDLYDVHQSSTVTASTSS